MSGNYQVQEFEIGTDSMQLGAAGPQFFTDAQLGRITINGIPYSANDPGNGSMYWNRDANLFVQFYNIPEPAALMLLLFGLRFRGHWAARPIHRFWRRRHLRWLHYCSPACNTRSPPSHSLPPRFFKACREFPKSSELFELFRSLYRRHVFLREHAARSQRLPFSTHRCRSLSTLEAR